MNKETNSLNKHMVESLYDWITAADSPSLYCFMLAFMQEPSISFQDDASSFLSSQDCVQSPVSQPNAINFDCGIQNTDSLEKAKQYTQNMPTPTPPQKDIFPLYLSEEDYLHLAEFQSNMQASYSSEEPQPYSQIKKENTSIPYILPLYLSEQNYLQLPQYQPNPSQSNYKYQTTKKMKNDEMDQYTNKVTSPPKEKTRIRESKHSSPTTRYYKPSPMKLNEKKPSYPGASTWHYNPKPIKLGQGETILHFEDTNSNDGLKRSRECFAKNRLPAKPHFFSQKNKQKKIPHEESLQITPTQNKR